MTSHAKALSTLAMLALTVNLPVLYSAELGSPLLALVVSGGYWIAARLRPRGWLESASRIYALTILALAIALYVSVLSVLKWEPPLRHAGAVPLASMLDWLLMYPFSCLALPVLLPPLVLQALFDPKRPPVWSVCAAAFATMLAARLLLYDALSRFGNLAGAETWLRAVHPGIPIAATVWPVAALAWLFWLIAGGLPKRPLWTAIAAAWIAIRHSNVDVYDLELLSYGLPILLTASLADAWWRSRRAIA